MQEAAPDGGGAARVSEDCLYLNVTAPDRAPPASGWPLLLWIHGGGNGMGSASDIDDGTVFARHGMVVVQIQYRLGAFGFLNLATTVDPRESDAGSAGLLDQIAALRWTHANAAAFDADPDRITLYGESAGAKAVAALMGSPLTAGRYQQVISASGGDSVASPTAAASVASRFLAHLGGAATPEVLRDLPAAQLLEAQGRVCPPNEAVWVWRPTLHHRALPRRPIDAVRAGSAAGVRALFGNNGDEAVFFTELWGTEHCLKPFDAALSEVFAGSASGSAESAVAELVDIYAASRGVGPTAAKVALMGDERYAIPTLKLAEAQSAHASVYRYRLDASPPNYPPSYAGGHTCDLPMAWQTTEMRNSHPERVDDHRIATAFHQALVAFIQQSKPQVAELPVWPTFDLSRRATMVLGAKGEVHQDPRTRERELWAGKDWEYSTWWPLVDTET